MMDTCKQQTQHKTITDRMLCDAGNPSVACEDRLLVTIQFPEIVDATSKDQQYAYANLRSRFGYTEKDLQQL